MDGGQLEAIGPQQRALGIAIDTRAGLWPWRRRDDTGRVLAAGGCACGRFRRPAVVRQDAGRARQVVDVQVHVVVEVVVQIAADRRWRNDVARRRGDAAGGERGGFERGFAALERRRRLRPHRLVQRAELVLVEIIGLLETRGAFLGLEAEQAAAAGADRIPVVGDDAERKGDGAFAVVFLLVVDRCRRGLLALGRNGLRCGFVDAFAADQAGGEQQQPGGRNGENDSQHHGKRAGRIGADEQARKAQDHVAEHAADAIGDRPGGGRGEAADHGGGDDRADGPGSEARGNARQRTPGDQRQRPGEHRKQGVTRQVLLTRLNSCT